MTARRNKDGIYVVRASLPVDVYSIQGHVSSIIDYLKNLEKTANEMGKIGEGNLEIDIEQGYYDSQHIDANFRFEREEYERERKTREAQEAKRKADEAAKRKAKRDLSKDPEYLEFQRLKNKFKD